MTGLEKSMGYEELHNTVPHCCLPKDKQSNGKTNLQCICKKNLDSTVKKAYSKQSLIGTKTEDKPSSKNWQVTSKERMKCINPNTSKQAVYDIEIWYFCYLLLFYLPVLYTHDFLF